jgi:hypothetical protein
MCQPAYAGSAAQRFHITTDSSPASNVRAMYDTPCLTPEVVNQARRRMPWQLCSAWHAQAWQGGPSGSAFPSARYETYVTHTRANDAKLSVCTAPAHCLTSMTHRAYPPPRHPQLHLHRHDVCAREVRPTAGFSKSGCLGLQACARSASTWSASGCTDPPTPAPAWKFSGSRTSTPRPSAFLYTDSALCSMRRPVASCCAPSLRAPARTLLSRRRRLPGASAAARGGGGGVPPQVAAAGADYLREREEPEGVPAGGGQPAGGQALGRVEVARHRRQRQRVRLYQRLHAVQRHRAQVRVHACRRAAPAAARSAAAAARGPQRARAAGRAAAGVRGSGGPHRQTGAGTGSDRPLSAWQQEGQRRCLGAWRKRATSGAA